MIKCFLITETNRCHQWLRRYHQDDPWHEARVQIEDGTVTVSPDETYSCDYVLDKTDPRFPTHCTAHPGCDYTFADTDRWMLHYERIYVDDTGNKYTLRDLPPGAMYYADWYPWWRGPDGHCLAVQTPGGVWTIDQPSSDGNPWQRTGTPPNITAHPSVHIIGKYHGWLRDGYLIEC